MCVLCRLKEFKVSNELLEDVQRHLDFFEGMRIVLKRIEDENPGTITPEEDEALNLLASRIDVDNDAFNEAGENPHEVKLSEIPDQVLAMVQELFGDDVEIKAVRVNADLLENNEYADKMRKLALDIIEDLPDNTPTDKRKLH